MTHEVTKGAAGELMTYGLASAGAALAWSISLPLALLIGPMVTMSVCAQRFTSLRVSKRAYSLGLMAVGVALGQYFTPQVLSTWTHIVPALVLTAISSLVGLLLGYWLLHHVFRHSPATAVFSALPGGILTVLEVSKRSDAQAQSVLFFQILRIVLGATLIPLSFAAAGFSVPSSGLQEMAHWQAVSLHDVLWLALGCVVLTWLGRRIQFPSAEISIPMLWSAVLYGTNTVSMTIPMWLPAAGFIVVGAAIGTLLPRPGLRRLLALIFQTMVLFLLFMGLTLVGSWVANLWIGMAFPVGFLAFSPSSLTEMIAVALALELDPVLVAANNLFRMIFCSLLAPLLLLWTQRRASVA